MARGESETTFTPGRNCRFRSCFNACQQRDNLARATASSSMTVGSLQTIVDDTTCGHPDAEAMKTRALDRIEDLRELEKDRSPM